MKDGERAHVRSDHCQVRLEERLRVTPEGTGRLDRRSEVMNEAMAEELQRNDLGERRKCTPAASASQATASVSHEMRETIELDPTPKSRQLMNSASAAASGSWQQHVRRPATDVEVQTPTEVSMEIVDSKGDQLPSEIGANTRRRIAVKTSLGGDLTKRLRSGNHHSRRN